MTDGPADDKQSRSPELPEVEESLSVLRQRLAAELSRCIELEEQLVHSQRAAAVGRVAGEIAHDFNNLLSVILTYSDPGVIARAHSELLRDHLQQVQTAAQRAAELSQELLAIARPPRVQTGRVDLNNAVASSHGLLSRLAGPDIQVRTVLTSRAVRVTVVAGRIEMMLMNMVLNARDALTNGGRVTIETAIDPGTETRDGPNAVVLTVSDNGTGMSPDVAARVFEPFFTTKPVGEGTGLGLSICQSIVARGGGHIDVESEPGRGTAFTVYLPLAPAEESSGTAEERPAGTETVLAVDDEESVRSIIGTVLRERGYTVFDAAGATEAARLADAPDTGRVHILIVDLALPDTDGRELAAQIRRSHPDIRVLFTSRYAADADEGERILHKPFTPGQLARAVRAVLDEQPG